MKVLKVLLWLMFFKFFQKELKAYTQEAIKAGMQNQINNTLVPPEPIQLRYEDEISDFDLFFIYKGRAYMFDSEDDAI